MDNFKSLVVSIVAVKGSLSTLFTANGWNLRLMSPLWLLFILFTQIYAFFAICGCLIKSISSV